MNASERSEAEIQKMQELEQAELQKACEIGRELERMEHEPCEDEYIKVPKKALKYRTAGMVAYNAEWLKNHFDIERAVICGKPYEDTVSREVFEQVVRERDIAIEQLNELGYEFGEKIEPKYCDRNICIKNEYNGIGCEDCEVNKSQKPSGDLISRQAVLDLVVANHTELNGLNVVMYSPFCKDMIQLPPVTPQQKMGHWIRWYEKEENDWFTANKQHCKCSECNQEYDPYLTHFIKYCNQCGAKMEETQEGSNKE